MVDVVNDTNRNVKPHAHFARFIKRYLPTAILPHNREDVNIKKPIFRQIPTKKCAEFTKGDSNSQDSQNAKADIIVSAVFFDGKFGERNGNLFS